MLEYIGYDFQFECVSNSDMNALYTVYLEIEYDRTNEGDYVRRVYSVDCGAEDLAFIQQLPNAALLGNGDTVLQASIHHGSSLARTPAEEHFFSLEELLIKFGSVHFKKIKT